MTLLSTVLATLVGCTVHIGVVPAVGAWSVGPVTAPVAEPDAGEWARDAVADALAARGALSAGADPARVTVTEAAWAPARRAGDTLLYEARLTLRIEAGGRTVDRTRVRTVVCPADAAAGRALRVDTLRALAREAADDAVTWVLAP